MNSNNTGRKALYIAAALLLMVLAMIAGVIALQFGTIWVYVAIAPGVLGASVATYKVLYADKKPF